MSSANTSQKLDKPGVTDEEKHCKHAEAQRKYRGRNLEATREKARERMSRLRENTKPLKARLQRKQLEAEMPKSRDVDATSYRLRKRKFVAEFGETAFHDYYLTHQRLLGVDELPGISRSTARTQKRFLGLQLQKFEAARDESGIGGVCPDSAKPKRDRLLAFTTTIFMVCKAPFYPNRRNYTSDREHDGNSRKSWFLVLPQEDAEHQAVVSGSPILTFPRALRRRLTGRPTAANFTPTGAQRRWEGLEEENEPPALPPLRHFRPHACLRSTTRACSVPANAVRASVKREVRASAKREPPVKDTWRRPRCRSSGKTVRSLPEPPAQAPNAPAVSPLPQPGLDLFCIEPVGVRGFERVPHSTSPSFSPPIPASSRPAAPHLHAGGSASTGVGTQSRRHAELPVLFNNSTRTLYKDAATAVREMGKEDSIQVLEVEDLEEFLSAPPRAAA
ncbi:hypothetical protein B0H13DRAFT_2305674 [Mycena leptocephala]|nr:hypothetical protein B0H13DRAFT_2305674 [Mycena leptocephala]